jgi:hypothetical protein
VVLRAQDSNFKLSRSNKQQVRWEKKGFNKNFLLVDIAIIARHSARPSFIQMYL